jgi:hypothetical protein
MLCAREIRLRNGCSTKPESIHGLDSPRTNQVKSMMKQNLLFHLTAGVAGLALLGLASAQADQQIVQPYEMQMQVNARVDTSDCLNSGGPEVTLSGEIALRGLKTKLIFKNNRKGTHTVSVVGQTDVVLLALGSSITIPKQPVRGGVGGNPHIYLQFHDGKGNALSEEFYLGRCVQGLTLSPQLVNEAIARADLHTEGCSNKGGPYITLGGQITLSGLHARFIFRNNLKGTHTAEDSRDVALLLEGSTITLPKQPVRGGVGGNPIICIQFLHGDGEPISDPVTLGRCNQL